MAKKKKPTISLEGLDDVVFNKDLDISSAQSVLESESSTADKVEEIVQSEMGEESKTVKQTTPEKSEKATTPKSTRTPVAKAKKEKKQPKSSQGTPPAEDKKRASFNIPKDLHRALKDYSYMNDIDMVTYIFEQLVKPDLKKKGYYPPKKRK